MKEFFISCREGRRQLFHQAYSFLLRLPFPLSSTVGNDKENLQKEVNG